MFVDCCPYCPRQFKAVGGDGPRPASCLIILERPGQDENRRGRVACGKTGQELDELYLPLAGLDRSEVRVCNTVLCGNASNKKPTDKEIAECAPFHIPDEIERTNPEFIILCGASACALVPGIKLDLHHGIPQPTSKVGKLFGWSGWLIPMFHPAIGLHESRWMTICIDDWKGLKAIIADNRWTDDPVEEPNDYTFAEAVDVVFDIGTCRTLGVDTESHAGKPWSVQYSQTPGMGRLVRVSDQESLYHLRRLVQETKEVILHNAAYDLEVLRKLGIRVRSYRDTMQESFALGNLPQGLKPLVYRLFRHTMTSYQETVWPASIRALNAWMLEAVEIAERDLTFVDRVQLKTKVREIARRGKLESLLRRLLKNASETSEYNPWGDEKEPRLAAFWHDETNEWMVAHIEGRIGPYPILGIGNCSMEQAVAYAVGDADWTGRVAVELERRRGESFKIYEGDRDI